MAIAHKSAVYKVLKGEGIIMDNEINTDPGELLNCKDILINEINQTSAKTFFTTCGWQIVRSVIYSVDGRLML